MIFQTLLQLARAFFGGASHGPRPPRLVRFFPSTAELPSKPVYEAVTRAYNLVGAAFGLLLLSPLLLVIALAVKLTSRGPVLYRGLRVGRGERPFHIFKFRTMQVGAEQKIGKRLVQQGEDHYTPIGKFLRRYRLDELAQLLNVLKGDMSLVGPRPVRPIFLEDHKRSVPGYARRFEVRPGITGQAQVRGGYYTHPRHKLFYEIVYILNRSVWLDMTLIGQTFLRVMTRIFTTGFLLAWLLLMALVLPRDLQNQFVVELGSVRFNVLYLVPTLTALWHVLRRKVTSQRLYALRTPVDSQLMGFMALAALAIPLSRFPEVALRGFFWFLCNGVVVFYLVLNSRLVTTTRTTLVNTLVGGTTVVAGLALGGWLDGRFFGGVFKTDLGNAISRQLVSGLIVLAAPLALARLRHAGRPLRRWLYAGALGTVTLAAIVIDSHAGLLCLVLGLCLYLWRVRRRYALVLAGVYLLGMAAVGLAGRERNSPTAMIATIQRDLERQTAVLSHVRPLRLLVGVGARTLPNHAQSSENQRNARLGIRKPAPMAENTFVTVLADHGVFGFGCFLMFLLGGIGFMFRSAPKLTESIPADDLQATASGLVALCVLMLTVDVLYRFPMMLMFWAAMGLGVGLALTHLPGPRTFYRLVHFRHHL